LTQVLCPIQPLRKIGYALPGAGIYLMKTLMDEVCFEKGGAVVHMCKNSNAGSAVKSNAQ
jgi:anti-sigma regulatory factor (Ser/Thr protein kinase)